MLSPHGRRLGLKQRLSQHDDGAVTKCAIPNCGRVTMRSAGIKLAGTVRNFVCGLGIMGTKEISHDPTQRACDT
jgi:hypothetical protein